MKPIETGFELNLNVINDITSIDHEDINNVDIEVSDNESSRCHTPLDTPTTICSDSEGSDSMPFMDLLLKLETSDQDWTWENNGYSVVHKICDTLQGELYKCRVEKDSLPSAPCGSFVAIKKTDKAMFDQKIAIKDEMTYLVDEDIVKEANVLKYLNGGNGIVQFLELFETESDYYLVYTAYPFVSIHTVYSLPEYYV